MITTEFRSWFPSSRFECFLNISHKLTSANFSMHGKLYTDRVVGFMIICNRLCVCVCGRLMQCL